METCPWTTVLAALLTPTIAIFGTIIAYRQWRIAQSKLKLDLFDRRFAVYDAARSVIGSVMGSGKAKDDELRKFLIGTREAKWLLNPDIADYLDKQLYAKLTELLMLDTELAPLPVGDGRTKNVHAQREIKNWLMAQLKVLDEKFSPFLGLGY